MNAPALRRIQAQKGWLLQQRREIHIRVGADQLQAEAVGLADAFVSDEGEHLQVVGTIGKVQGEIGVGHDSSVTHSRAGPMPRRSMRYSSVRRGNPSSRAAWLWLPPVCLKAR